MSRWLARHGGKWYLDRVQGDGYGCFLGGGGVRGGLKGKIVVADKQDWACLQQNA